MVGISLASLPRLSRRCTDGFLLWEGWQTFTQDFANKGDHWQYWKIAKIWDIKESTDMSSPHEDQLVPIDRA